MASVHKTFACIGLPTCPRRRAQWRQRGFRRARAAFTMIEILVVIGVLVVLASIVLLGMRHITGRSKEQQTRVSMQNLRNMLAEYNAATRMKAPREWWWWDPSGSQTLVEMHRAPFNSNNPNVNPAVDFWRVPYRNPLQPPPPNGGGVALPIPAPRNVTPAGPDRQRHAVVNTAIAMATMSTIPANRNWLQSFQDRLMQFDTSDVTLLAMINATANVREEETRIPLDGWGNPIIVVPGSGMYDVQTGGQTLTQANPIKAPDGQPFWASAGPDGDFSRGDDNVYSFDE